MQDLTILAAAAVANSVVAIYPPALQGLEKKSPGYRRNWWRRRHRHGLDDSEDEDEVIMVLTYNRDDLLTLSSVIDTGSSVTSTFFWIHRTELGTRFYYLIYCLRDSKDQLTSQLVYHNKLLLS
ncbi:hypothetical protein WAI453_007061 [Rhynchosporium graminicola]|uniref:Uncharacterized protein n=1 Tax=Rhynchosporium graminicola TaxID=2792576 RepID=A0A1E1LH77_9HELO|nr:uncharacterized protein RCO7_02200 [Rhynchosporium commune]